jgi:hypothetical protein
MLQQFLGGGTFLRVPAQAKLYELLEWLGEVPSKSGRRVLGDQEQHLHRVDVGVRGVTTGQFDRRDSQRPDVCLVVIT